MQREQLISEYLRVMAMVARQLMPIKARSAAALGLSRPQAEVLHLLSCRDQATIKLMAELLGITSSAATQLTEGLVQQKLVERKASDSDRRVVEVRLTKAGQQKVDGLHGASHAYIKDALQGMTDKELADLLVLLRKLAHSCGADKDCK